MKMMRRLVSLVLTLCLLASMLPAVVLGTTEDTVIYDLEVYNQERYQPMFGTNTTLNYSKKAASGYEDVYAAGTAIKTILSGDYPDVLNWKSEAVDSSMSFGNLTFYISANTGMRIQKPATTEATSGWFAIRINVPQACTCDLELTTEYMWNAYRIYVFESDTDTMSETAIEEKMTDVNRIGDVGKYYDATVDAPYTETCTGVEFASAGEYIIVLQMDETTSKTNIYLSQITLTNIVAEDPAEATTEATVATTAPEEATAPVETTVPEGTVIFSDALWEYTTYDSGVALTAYLGDAADVCLPSTVKYEETEYAVVKLGDGLFRNNDAINSVTLSDSVVEIGKKAFYDADNLICIVTNETLTTIGAEAFYSCDSFNSVILYESVITIGENAFAECPKLTAWCDENSKSHNYAETNNIPYKIIDPSATPETVVLEGVTYYLINGEAIAIDYDESSTQVKVYAIVRGYPVTKLRETFKDCRALESVTLPETLQVIGMEAFYDCKSLQSVTIPEGVTSIESYAFYSCFSLESVTIPDGVTNIGDSAFALCIEMTNVTIPDTVTNIGDNAFAHCLSLTDVVISNGVIAIGNSVFLFCFAMESITIPSSVTSLGNDVFDSCRSLVSIFVDENNTAYSSDDCGVLFNRNKTTLIRAPEGYSGSYIIPESVKTISESAFSSCASLTSVTIPDSVTTIGDSAFSGCDSLNYNTYGNGRYLGNDGNPYFALINFKTSNTTTCSIPSGTKIIADYLFRNCKSLTSIFVDQNNTAYSSDDCGVLFNKNKTTLIRAPEGLSGAYIITESVTTIAKGAFYGCTSLINLTISDSTTTIGESAFYGCTSLTSVTIPDSTTTIGESAFNGCTSLTSVTIPDGITTIAESAFSGCTSLTSVTIPDGVTTIAESAFIDCSSLTSVTIPDSVTTIAFGAFFGCSSLTIVALGINISRIDFLAFGGCDIIADVYYNGSETQWGKISIDAGNEDLIYATIHFGEEMPEEPTVPDDLVSDLTWALDSEGILTISGIGAMANYSRDDGAPWYSYGSEITSVVIENGVTTIGAYAFAFCPNLTSITIPDSVTSIGKAAFQECTHLTNLTIPDSTTTIGESAFEDCNSLTSVTIPDGITTIAESAFSGCSSLTSVAIGDGVTSIRSYAFARCKNLTSIAIPESIKEIGNYAFDSCYNLAEVTIPESLTSIGRSAFEHCISIQRITIPEGIATIENYMFSHCESLQSVTISEGATSIGVNAFYKCSSLQTVILPKSILSISVDSFPDGMIHMVYENSYAHTFAKENDLLYFVLRETENPEVHFGTGISGVVTYTDGTAANGATVEILYNDGTVKETVTTEADGSYAFTYAEVGRYTIKVTDASGNTASTQMAVKRMNAFDVFVSGDTALTLKKGYIVSGQVNISGATVTITDQQSHMIGSMVADESGNFVFENIPNGTYILSAKTDSGSVSQEITVFDSSVSGIILNIATETATIWGYTAVQDRNGEQSKRNWVQVTAYNAEGIAVAQCKSDKDGKYTFSGLPLGQYAIVAEAAEMRTNKNNKFERSYTLTGYAYVTAGEAKEYQADIVLYEENEKLATVSGKVTAQGQKQVSTVTLRNVFRHEIASYQTKSNGKYSFSNVRDGLYFITAVTESDGMGYAVIVVRDGVVHGETDITVLKSDKVKDREDKFNTEVPPLNGREEALAYRTRIADEKRFYDSLSEKEKKQLSKDYIERLNRYAEWIAETDYNANEVVTVEQGGLVISGDELDSGYQVDFNITVEKVDRHTASTDGVHNRDDFIYHTMDDVADHQNIQQCYEISMSKTVNGEEKQITSVYKDTNATGKFRVVLEIPEEYRGYKHYSMLHDHCGEVVKLADLDDDPNTITIEVDAFSTFVMTATNENLTGCEHTTVENGVCTDCGETFGVAVVDGDGNEKGIYATLAEALNVAVSGQTVQLRADASMDIVILTSGVDLDLNGYTLTVNSVQTYESTNVVDSDPSNNGLLKINDADGNMIDQTNTQLPVYDSKCGGYRFFTVFVISHTITGKNSMTPKYWFKVEVENLERFNTLILAGSEVLFKIYMTWEGQTVETSAVANLAFTQTWVQKNVSGNTYITVSVAGSGELENFSLTPCIISGGVALSGTEM